MPAFERRDADGKRIMEGTKISSTMLCDREIIFLDAEFGVKSKYNKPATVVQVEDNQHKFKFFTNNAKLTQVLQYVADNHAFPFRGTLRRANSSGLPDYTIE